MLTVRPCLSAFLLALAFPPALRGPVLRDAFRLFGLSLTFCCHDLGSWLCSIPCFLRWPITVKLGRTGVMIVGGRTEPPTTLNAFVFCYRPGIPFARCHWHALGPDPGLVFSGALIVGDIEELF